MDYTESAKDFLGYMRQLYKLAMFKDLNDLSQGEMALLGYLAFCRDGATAGELTAAFEIGTSRTAAILNTLEKKQFAKRIVDDNDRRKVLVYITEQGRQEIKKKHEESVVHVADFLSLLGPDDAKEYMRIIRDALSRTTSENTNRNEIFVNKKEGR